MSPRILFVDHTARLGGAEMSLLSLAGAFRDTAQTVLFEDGPFMDRLRAADLPATVLPAPAGLDRVRRAGSIGAALQSGPALLLLAARLARVARTADVLVANSQKSMLVAGLAGLVARRPVVWILRDLMSEAHFGALQRGVATAAANRLVDCVIANSGATRDALVSTGVGADRIRVVHNGIDAAPFDAVRPERVAAARRELGLPAAGVVGVFSRLSEWKGQHVLLQALRDLPAVTALLVGDALFPADEAYAARLRADVERWGLADRVRMPGFRDDIPVLMRACDAVCHTSTAPEPFGRVVVEGMLAGRPVIATRAGGPGEIIDHESTGLLVPGGDPSALRGAIHGLLTRPEHAAAMGRRARKAAGSRFSVARMVDGVRSVLHDVVGLVPAGHP